MAENLYVIIGASGHVGGVLATRLLDAGRRVRVIGRNPDHLHRFVARGAEQAIGSVDDAAFLRKAFEGAKAVFAMVPPNFAIQSGFRAWMNQVADAQAQAVEAAGATHLVAMSSVGGHLAQGAGPVSGLHDMEERLKKVPNLNLLVLRPGYFLENHLSAVEMIKGMGAIFGALKPELPIPMIATKDIGEVAAKRLLALDFKGASVLELLGARDASMDDVARVFGQAIGKPEVKYQQVPYDQAEQSMVGAGLSAEMAGLYNEMNRALNDGRMTATQPRTAETTTPTTLEAFAREVFVPAFNQ